MWKGVGWRGGGDIRDCNCDQGTVLGCGNRGMSFKVFTVCPQSVRPCHMTFLAVTSTYPNICHWRSENGTQKSANILFLFDFLQSDQRFLSVKRITTQCKNANLFELSIHGLWQPTVHSDGAFWSFDVGSTYHCEWACHESHGLTIYLALSQVNY